MVVQGSRKKRNRPLSDHCQPRRCQWRSCGRCTCLAFPHQRRCSDPLHNTSANSFKSRNNVPIGLSHDDFHIAFLSAPSSALFNWCCLQVGFSAQGDHTPFPSVRLRYTALAHLYALSTLLGAPIKDILVPTGYTVFSRFGGHNQNRSERVKLARERREDEKHNRETNR